MSLCVQDVMVRDVVTIDADYSVKYAARMMNYFGISSLIVLSKGEIVGILTERDVLTRVVAPGRDPEKVMAREVMSKPVIVVSPTMPLEDAVKIMFQRRIKKLPVVRKGKKGSRLIGMLSLTDVARLQPQMMETMRELLPTAAQASEEVGFYVR
ncbi:CBS domain-containing protein [Candidatus Bathyarchaeota archaeon]|nr:MAG: CBS domain-containing protein [Candidatus Bathyarchaeota archaeon]